MSNVMRRKTFTLCELSSALPDIALCVHRLAVRLGLLPTLRLLARVNARSALLLQPLVWVLCHHSLKARASSPVFFKPRLFLSFFWQGREGSNFQQPVRLVAAARRFSARPFALAALCSMRSILCLSPLSAAMLRRVSCLGSQSLATIPGSASAAHNPSIEATVKKLRFLPSPHVKR